VSGFWQLLARQLFSPQAPFAAQDQALHDLQQKHIAPVIWLLGKTQSGKSSIVRTLTGREDAEIGLGFKACTHTACLYEFPSPEDCLLQFLDTRGLGEVCYDPCEDLAQFQTQAHILLVVMRAMDHNQHEVLTAARQICKARRDWPLLVAQTALHEGYPNRQFEHIVPYPFDAELANPQIPVNLRRSLQIQRSWFKDLPQAQFVAIDLTRQEDDYAPTDYGAQALWNALLDEAMPQGMRNLLRMIRQQGKDHYLAAAHPHIIAYTLMAAAAEAMPIPFVSIPLVLSVQAKMFHAVASIYGQTLSYERFAEISGLLGGSYLLGLGGRQLIKFIPVYGEAVTAAYSGALTYALGHLLCAYFEHIRQGKVMSREKFELEFAANMERAKQFLANYAARGQG